MPPLTDDSVKMAVEVAKAGMPVATGPLLHSAEIVAKFIEVVAKKIHDLKLDPSASQY